MRLSTSLAELGFRLGRLKTGTPPRLDARTIDFSQTIPQYGSNTPLYFSVENVENPPDWPNWLKESPHPVYPLEQQTKWRPQLPCYMVYTQPETHQVIRANLHRAPMFTGVIEGIGPRYCPSLEDKIVRFAHKESHQLFLEPEGWQTTEVYLQGANTSLPEDVQWEMGALDSGAAECGNYPGLRGVRWLTQVLQPKRYSSVVLQLILCRRLFLQAVVTRQVFAEG